LSGVSRGRKGDVLAIGHTKDQFRKIGQATVVGPDVIVVSIGGISGQVIFAGERVPDFVIIGVRKANTGVLEIIDKAGVEVGVVDEGAKTHVSRDHGPIGISGKGDSSALAVIEGGVLSEDEGSDSRAVNLDREDGGCGLEVLGSISTDTETNPSVSGAIADIAGVGTLNPDTACAHGIGIESKGLELPSGVVISNGEVAEVEGISGRDNELGAEQISILSAIVTAVVLIIRTTIVDE